MNKLIIMIFILLLSGCDVNTLPEGEQYKGGKILFCQDINNQGGYSKSYVKDVVYNNGKITYIDLEDNVSYTLFNVACSMRND